MEILAAEGPQTVFSGGAYRDKAVLAVPDEA